MQVDELSKGLVMVTQKMNERLAPVEASMKEMLSPQGPTATVCTVCSVLCDCLHETLFLRSALSLSDTTYLKIDTHGIPVSSTDAQHTCVI